MDFAALVAHFDRLDATTKRLEMTRVLVDVLEALAPEEVEAAARLLQGKVRPDWEGVELGLAEKLVLQVIARAAGLDPKRGTDRVVQAYHDAGDLGLAAEHMLQGGHGAAQVGLMAFTEAQEAGPSVQDIHARLLDIARRAGAGSQEDKQQMLWKLLTDVGPREARYIVRMVAGRLRLGIADQTFLDALAAWHEGRGVQSVQEMDPDERAAVEATRRRLEAAFDRCSDLPRVAAVLATGGMDAVDAIRVAHGVPLRPMAAERLKTLGDILEKHGRSALEYKYDGLRVQAHVSTDPQVPVRLFSRRMEELTAQFPDVQDALRQALVAGAGTDDEPAGTHRHVIVEGECVAMDRATGRMRPFQDISRRRGRKSGLGEATRKEAALAQGAQAGATMMDEVPVTVFLFDCLAVDHASVMDEPYTARRARLGRMLAESGSVQVSTSELCEDEAAMEAFFQRAVQDGAEGIMCKHPDAPYKAGNRGFDWIKFKTDYTELVDTMDLAVIGAFYGRGRRAGWYGALLMAAYDPDAGRWTSICKLGTGFDDATLMGLKERFRPHEAKERPPEVDSTMQPDVWLHPAIVMEVQAAELTLSPVHRAAWGRVREGAGLAMRFPRFSGRWRDDKAPEQATTVDEVVRMHEEQTKR